MEEDNLGVEVLCPYCGKPVLIPAGYSRDMYLCPRCHKAIPITPEIRERLDHPTDD